MVGKNQFSVFSFLFSVIGQSVVGLSVLSLFILFSLFPSPYSLVPEASAQVNISGPTPVPPNVPGIIVPNPYMGGRTIYPGNEQVAVGAQVGDFIVNISGLASPNASVFLTSEGQFLRSTVADSDGYFYISQLTVRTGFSGFCLDSVDFKRIGESQGCLEFAPITKSRDFTDIFLPPTIGLFRKQINAGDEALIFGYSMPGAKVAIKLRNGDIFETTGDAQGYYEYRYEKVPAGTYYLASVGEFEGLKSLPPKKEAELKVLSIPEQVTARTTGFAQDIGKLLTTSLWGFLLLILLLILIILIFLIVILKPAWIRVIFDKLKKHAPLHHDWLLLFIEQRYV